jgi:hypothetical protein
MNWVIKLKQYKCNPVILINMPITIINAENHNNFRIVPATNNMERQFILTKYGRTYNMCDDGQSHYLNLCENMRYVFGLEPGYYKTDIKGDSIHLEYITDEEYNRCNPQEDKPHS